MAITTRPPTCEGCLLHETPGCSGFMPAPEGKNLIPLLIVGEALGESEAKDSLPFRPYAESGSLLERALRSVGIQREQISITNLIHCRPPNNRFAGEYYEDPAAQHCRQYLDAEVARLKPRAILALGSIPFKYLSGFSMRGKQAQDYTRGYPVESVWYPGIPVIGTYHPAYLRRGATELFPVVVHDLHKALQIARGRVQWDRIPERTYQVGGVPELQQLYAIFSAHPDRLIAFDIETRESSNEDEDKYDGLSRDAQILTVQFAHSPRTGLSVPWDEQTIPWIQAILALPNPRSGHNCWMFDEPVLKHQGIKLPQLSRDTMAMWHHLQPDLPANLAFVASFYGIERPWKHEMGEDLGIYGCTDVDAVQRIESRIESDLRALRYKDPRTGETGITLWDGFEQYVQPLRPILKRMEERGIPRDLAATQELITYIDTEKARLWELIQAACPSAIRPVKRWVEWPEDLRPAVKAYAEAHPIVPISPKTGKPLKERVPVIKIGDGLNIDELVIAAGELGYKFGLVPNLDKDCVYKLQDFLPNSTDHLKNYLRYFAVKVPVNLSDEETTGRTELDKLMKRLKLISEADGVSKIPTAIWQSAFAVKANKDTFPKLKQAAQEVHAFLENILTYRKLHKAKATYITGEGWTPNSTTGRIHTTFTLSATATLQLSSRKPNVQNIPKGKNPKDKVGMMLGRLLRKTVKAKPGHLIVECVVPKTRILKRDLTWAPAGDLKVGDELLGFDEYPVTAPSRKDPSVNSKRPGRYLRSSTITNVSRLIKECLIITTDKGQVTCSKDHSWLVAATSGPCVWKQAENLKPGDAISYFTDPWTVENSYDAGWLAGFLDGEGYAVGSSRGAGRGMGFGQNPGPVLDKVLRLLKERGFETSRDGGENGKLCEKYRITGQPFAWLRLIGKVRPERLLPKAHKTVEGMAYWGGNSSPAKIISIRNGGAREVVAMETTTHTFIAEGMLSHNCDYSGCHLVTMGLEAEDPNYIRIARIDGHSFLAAHMANTTLKSGRPEDLYSSEGVKLVYNDLLSEFESDVITPVDQKALLIKAQQRFIYDCEQAFADLDRWLDYDDRILAAKLAWVKKNFKGLRNDKAKPALLGNQLGLGSRKLYALNDDSFKNEAEAKQVQAILAKLFPKIGAYQARTRALAQRQGYLISPYGSIRRFFEVERFDPKTRGLVPGLDAEKAGAFFVQTNAQGKLREAMIELEEEGWNERCNLTNQVHDSLVYEMPIELCAEAIPAIAAIMERPAKRLKHPTICPEGLVLQCEASIGVDWGSIEEVKIKDGKVVEWPEAIRGLMNNDAQ